VTGPSAFAWFLAALLVLHVGVQLYAGRLNLYAAPRAWLDATRKLNPNRFWAFLIAEFVVLATLMKMLIQ
jgi:hypothetical protein